jgi:hypothetical protein
LLRTIHHQKQCHAFPGLCCTQNTLLVRVQGSPAAKLLAHHRHYIRQYHLTIQLNINADALPHRTRDLSGLKNGYGDWGFPRSSLLFPSKCQVSTSRSVTTASFHITSNSLTKLHQRVYDLSGRPSNKRGISKHKSSNWWSKIYFSPLLACVFPVAVIQRYS